MVLRHVHRRKRPSVGVLDVLDCPRAAAEVRLTLFGNSTGVLLRALQKSGGFDSLRRLREDDSPMSRRDLSQPSFVDALVSGCGKSGGFLDRIEQAFDWPAFEALLAPIHASTRGAPGYQARHRDSKRALDVAGTALGVARASRTSRRRSGAASGQSVRAAHPRRRSGGSRSGQGLRACAESGLGPEQGHGLRILGDIMAVKGDAAKADELHGLARAKFRSLGMKRWAEGPG
jgi:hypothetical protein